MKRRKRTQLTVSDVQAFPALTMNGKPVGNEFIISIRVTVETAIVEDPPKKRKKARKP